jgi:uncharacterized protein
MPYPEQIGKKLPELRNICAKYHVRKLALFGSALRSNFTAESDLDFLVEFDQDAAIGLFELAGMQMDLEELFGRKIDLVPKKGLKPALQDALSEAQLVYAG